MLRYMFCAVLFVTSQAASAAPPKVVKAEPDNGDVNVSPSLTMIRVTFDQPMEKGGMSIVGSGDQFPEMQGDATWADDRTITMKVKLQPNHDYRLSINNQQFKNFANRAGESAEPYPIQFRTGAAGSGKATSSGAGADAKANRRAYNLLRAAIRNDYSYRDRLSIDWEKLFKSAESSLMAAGSANDFAKVAAMTLAKAKDKHVLLQVDGEMMPTYVNPMVMNANYSLLPKLVPDLQRHTKMLISGRWKDGIGYIGIAAWDKEKLGGEEKLNEVLKSLADTSGLIIDVRANGGGAEPLAQQVVGHFVSSPKLYGKNVYRDAKQPSGFTEPKERWLQPIAPEYKGKVAVLSGPVVMSSCESFLLMMKQDPNATIVGAKSQGCSGNPKPHDLGNGVTVYLPSWKDMTADGKELEGVGVAPDIEVSASASDFQDRDPVMEKALEILRGAKK